MKQNTLTTWVVVGICIALIASTISLYKGINNYHQATQTGTVTTGMMSTGGTTTGVIHTTGDDLLRYIYTVSGGVHAGTDHQPLTGALLSSFGTKDVNITLPISGNAVASMMIGLLSGDTLHIQVIQDLSQTGTVLRLNQIMSPDWKLDGPFSDNYDFSATESGTYMFIIGENLMAAEAKYTGDIHVMVRLVR